uniref:Sulfatase-modifying factor enzyme-like domain-containing protein n=1 Tax=uncultured bacterium BLR18 TaxID=506518 RepID=C0INM9_9BACT|nr:hypothetical protein AKSOIL_0300 [uncultured bacterium BLR18]
MRAGGIAACIKWQRSCNSEVAAPMTVRSDDADSAHSPGQDDIAATGDARLRRKRIRYRAYGGLPVRGARAGLPMACPMLAQRPAEAEPSFESTFIADVPDLANLADTAEIQGVPVPSDTSDMPGDSSTHGPSGSALPPGIRGTPGAFDAAAGRVDPLAAAMPDTPGATPHLAEGAPATPDARRQRLILMCCGAAVTIGVGVAIALLMDEASAPLRLGTGSPAAVQTSGASGVSPGHVGGGASASGISVAATDAACPLPGGPAACPTMVAVPAGRYRIGAQRSDPDAQEEELGGTERPIAAFELSSHEITAGQWQQCVNDQACPLPVQAADSAAMPVTGISWDAAASYAAWLSRKTGHPYRLPTEAEWEYAARAGAATVFPWGDRLGLHNAHCGQCGASPDFPRYAPVGSYPARRGLYDMVGNAYEWVADCWTPNHAQAAPPAPAACRDKVQKGGAFDTLEADVRPIARTHGDRAGADLRVGFRVARALPPSAPTQMSMQATERTQR